MSRNKIDPILLLLTIFLGFLGIDKIYMKSIKFFLLKLIANIFIIGFIWAIVDIVFAIMGRYQVNPIDYFK